jgi:hypothetical protein
MPEVTFFWSGNNQSITFNKPQGQSESFLAPQKIMNFIIALLLIRFVQQFPPVNGAFATDLKVRELQNFERLNRTIRSENWNPKPSSETENPKPEKTKLRKVKGEDISIPEFIDVSLPNGIQLSAAGYYTVFILSVLCGLIFVCERFTNIIMCICNRLNTPAQNVEVERVR